MEKLRTFLLKTTCFFTGKKLRTFYREKLRTFLQGKTTYFFTGKKLRTFLQGKTIKECYYHPKRL